MNTAFRLLLVLLLAALGIALIDDRLVAGGVTAIVALLVALLAAGLKPGETTQLRRLVGPAGLLASVPLLFLVAQLLPLPPLAHPIWISAAGALGQSVSGYISIEPGLTLLALANYLTAAGLVLATTGIAIDRQRAEAILTALAIVTSGTALVLTIHDFFGLTFLGEVGRAPRAVFELGATLGVVFTLAFADMSLERFETRRFRVGLSRLWLLERLSVALAGLLLCAFVVVYFCGTVQMVATGGGVALFVGIVAIRRIHLGVWTAATVAAGALIGIAIILFGHVGWSELDVSLSATARTRADLATLERMIADNAWTGTGAGTFATLASIYGVGPSPGAPSTAAELLVAFGKPGLWSFMATAAAAVVVLALGALRRGRDSFHSAAAASAVVIVAVESFRSADLLGTAPAILGCITLGLGFAQRAGRKR